MALPQGYAENRSPLPKTVSCLVTPNPSIAPDLTVDAVGTILRRNKDLYYLPVVQDKQPIGLIRRLDFMDIFLSNFGRELHGRKPAILFMDPKPLIIPEELLLEDASRLVTGRTDRFSDPHAFIIVRDRCYSGLGWTLNLLEKITDLRVHEARYANPLTLLPGNVPIQDRIEAALKSRRPFAVAYCDLDHFKPFNDVYGYQKGDQLIQQVGQILVTHTDPEQDFVGHIGGDDFIVIFASPDWRPRCEHILEVFGQAAPRFYTEDDQHRGGIMAHDRRDQEQFFPLLSLSIGVVQPDIDDCRSHHDVAALAAEAKHQAKLISGNSLFVERRRSAISVFN
ncbi:GGDEF domain-containing protein [Candidatus Contendibacter odensensis]|uniref:diguanylate cyclase n=1 Tax=Candidatus Contendobacter odensis Run_B_J11 TaxID=1400861 RepID=A0A7U7G7V2_9GAMM|nr:GGDEF domain-containing protein [Candidatus Contendobacter odensis]CDH43096.1 putative Diguanylate cyclase [Candidatus Contendobacter odensis Run_B_J11]